MGVSVSICAAAGCPSTDFPGVFSSTLSGSMRCQQHAKMDVTKSFMIVGFASAALYECNRIDTMCELS